MGSGLGSDKRFDCKKFVGIINGRKEILIHNFA